jgi:hypothetical protein
MSELIYNIHDIFDSVSRRGCLQQHGCGAFRIPPYQRGYKWGSEKDQPVESLLSDLKQAWRSKAKEYLLQAITVKKVPGVKSGSVLEVIDGQQRLTTLFILIHALNFRVDKSVRPNIAAQKLQYSIRHKTHSLDELVASWIESVGNSSDHFDQLKNNHSVEKEDHQDSYYLKCAALRCMDALRSQPGEPAFQNIQDIGHFRNYVLRDVKLMVNAVEAHVSGEVVFGNLNTNRVVLTELELIKGLLLTRVAREPAGRYREVLEMRIQLGRKWDEINHWVNLPEIRSLYFSAFENGMNGLLELVARQLPHPFRPPKQSTDDGKPVFEYFLRQTHLDPVFRLLANTYARLQDWYTDDRSYHLLGYCLMYKKAAERLPFLAEQLRFKTRSELNKQWYRLRSLILLRGTNDPVGAALDKLGYAEDNAQIQSILLALSIFQGVDDSRFNFHAYQKEKWSLEHIFPQTPFGKGARLNDGQKKAALDVLVSKGKDLLAEALIQRIAQARDSANIAEMETEISQLLESEPLLHQIGNLCLLSPGDNAAMGCGMFDEKRNAIRDRIARGSFVPRHTYEVFSKMIVGANDSLDVWSKADISKHQCEIERRIGALIREGT